MNSSFSPFDRRTNNRGSSLISIIPSSRQPSRPMKIVETVSTLGLFAAIAALTAVLWKNLKNGDPLFGSTGSAYGYQQQSSATDLANGDTQRGYASPAVSLAGDASSATPAKDRDLTTSGTTR